MTCMQPSSCRGIKSLQHRSAGRTWHQEPYGDPAHSSVNSSPNIIRSPGPVRNMLRTLIDLNRRLCRHFTPTHIHEANVFGVYRKLGVVLLSHPEVARVLDCGAGKAWHFPIHYKRWYKIHLVGVDIDASEMAHNEALDEKIECDVTDAIPVPSGSIDLVMVSSGIEHFRDNKAFLQNAYASLRPGG